jgi:hypothetical protein
MCASRARTGYERTHLDPKWLGPSWAWTSINGPVHHKPYPYEYGIREGSCNILWSTTLICRELVDQRAPFGAVHQAVLGITSQARRVQVQFHPGKDCKYTVHEKDVPVKDSSLVSLKVDTSRRYCDRALLDAPVYLVFALLNVSEKRAVIKARGLVLVAVSRNGDVGGKFERHGLFDCRKGNDEQDDLIQEWVKNSEEVYFEVQ